MSSWPARGPRSALTVEAVHPVAGPAPLERIGDDDHFTVMEVIQNAVGESAHAPAADLWSVSPVRDLRPGGRRLHDVKDRGNDSDVEVVAETDTDFLVAAYRFQ